jgi:hypothetical protein
MDEKKQEGVNRQQQSLRILQSIAIKILENDDEPEAQKLIANWVKKYHSNWFQTLTSVPANLMVDFGSLIKN